jgi:hypothetical protein
MTITEGTPVSKAGCCPPLHPCEACDELDIRYRLPFRPAVKTPDGDEQVVPVEVTLRFRLERCAGPLSLGDLLYTTTLLPGEQVRLLTSDRNTRFSYDSQTKLASRQYSTSEESFFLAGMANAMSDLTVVAGGSQHSAFRQSATSGGEYAGLDLGFLNLGGYVSASSYDANAASTFASFLSQHAQSASRQVETSVHAASSTSVAEVATRSHADGESEDQYEAASRRFSNPNRCHALTYLFYRIVKCQKVRFTLVAIDRRIDDPACPTDVQLNSPPPAGGGPEAAPAAAATKGAGPRSPAPEPIPADVRALALSLVDADLRGEGLLDVAGHCSREIVERLSWERTLRLPTPGVMVKACLDECDSCEPARKREIELELDAKELENRLLRRRTELLEKSQEYRCCPGQAYGEDDAAAS